MQATALGGVLTILITHSVWGSPVWSAAIPAVQPTRAAVLFAAPVSGRLSSRFGLRWHPVRAETRRHSGIDLAAAAGAPVRAARAGVVRYAGWSGDYGLLVEIDHGLWWRSRYAHLSELAVTPGQRVGRGAVIGAVGATGMATGAHLHFELRYAGAPLDPLPFMQRMIVADRARP